DRIAGIVEPRVLEDADDFLRLRIVSIAEPEVPADSVRAWQVAMDERFVDHRDERSAGAVSWFDCPAGDEPDPERLGIRRRNVEILCFDVLAGFRRVAFDGHRLSARRSAERTV